LFSSVYFFGCQFQDKLFFQNIILLSIGTGDTADSTLPKG